MKQSILQNVVWKEGEHYVAQCLNVDISSFGASRDEALRNLDEALNLYLEDDTHEDLQSVESPEIVGISVKYA
jgi:predicted RNase H-like HicB family nuclease